MIGFTAGNIRLSDTPFASERPDKQSNSFVHALLGTELASVLCSDRVHRHSSQLTKSSGAECHPADDARQRGGHDLDADATQQNRPESAEARRDSNPRHEQLHYFHFQAGHGLAVVPYCWTHS